MTIVPFRPRPGAPETAPALPARVLAFPLGRVGIADVLADWDLRDPLRDAVALLLAHAGAVDPRHHLKACWARTMAARRSDAARAGPVAWGYRLADTTIADVFGLSDDLACVLASLHQAGLITERRRSDDCLDDAMHRLGRVIDAGEPAGEPA